MKKLATVFIISLVLVTSLYGQVIFIPKAGASWASVAFSEDIKDYWGGDLADFGSKAGLIIGVAAEIPLVGEMFALQPEILFHQKGYTYTYEDIESSQDYKKTLNYLEVPVLAKATFGKFYAIAGPTIGFGIGGKYKGSYTDQGKTTDDNGKIKFGEVPDNYGGDDEYIDNSVDFGFELGVGVKVSAFVIDLRYGIGLTNLYDEVHANTSDVQSLNRSLQLTVGFPVGGAE